MNKELIRLIQNMLIKNEPMLKKYIAYFKKAGTNSLNGKEISPELRTIMLDDIAKDIKRTDYGHYQLTESEHPRKYHENRSDYLMYDEYNPDYIKNRLNSLENRYNRSLLESEELPPLPRRNDDLEHFSDYYQGKGDDVILNNHFSFGKAEPEDLSIDERMLLSDKMEKSHSNELIEALEENPFIDAPVKQYTNKELFTYVPSDNKSLHNVTDDINEFNAYRDKFSHTINKEEEIKNLIENNMYDDLDKNTDELLELKNLIRFINNY